MIRTFYPIGQGAFFTEKHDNINVVYDCGSKSRKNRVDEKIRNAFDNEIIDILFVSHYDEDHINKIHLLLESNTIKVAILPLLEEIDRILLYNFYLALGLSKIARLLNSPKDFFGGETKIFFVMPGDYTKGEGQDSITVTIKELQSRNDDPGNNILENKTIIAADPFWEYIPYNFSFFERNEEFIDLLSQYNIDIEALRNDVNYGLKNTTILRKIYKEVAGNINENSLIVYSGPIDPSKYIMDFNSHFLSSYHYRYFEKTACIYTGDSNFNNVNISYVFASKWDLVGTIQIPHHGSKKDFNDNFLGHHSLICPISFGNENTYGHPNIKAVETIASRFSIPVLITENTESLHIQTIR